MHYSKVSPQNTKEAIYHCRRGSCQNCTIVALAADTRRPKRRSRRKRRIMRQVLRVLSFRSKEYTARRKQPRRAAGARPRVDNDMACPSGPGGAHRRERRSGAARQLTDCRCRSVE
ncbi:hypothetical protein EVAR_15697_1 [Eumeta japonica]|uniref:Uncharacterized protein n=1 Tax=Eumeta variegata TaxID=151549 RepID=A0A4C1U9A6_EUMVA|nr:hypothetical protein EVAR_15697_1 [Eumeta japonica]